MGALAEQALLLEIEHRNLREQATKQEQELITLRRWLVAFAQTRGKEMDGGMGLKLSIDKVDAVKPDAGFRVMRVKDDLVIIASLP